MKNKKTRYMTILTAAIALSLTSCVKDELFNTPHPDLGAVIVTTDWSAKSAEAEIPQNYTLRMGTEEQAASGIINTFKTLAATRQLRTDGVQHPRTHRHQR